MKNDNTIDLNRHYVNTLKFNDRSAKLNRDLGYNKFIFSIIGIIFLLLLIANVYRNSLSGDSLSFTSFLNWLGNVDSIRINFSISDFYIYGNWGIVDGIRNFFNIFTTFFGVIVFLSSQLINLIIFVGQFIGFLFT